MPRMSWSSWRRTRTVARAAGEVKLMATGAGRRKEAQTDSRARNSRGAGPLGWCSWMARPGAGTTGASRTGRVPAGTGGRRRGTAPRAPWSCRTSPASAGTPARACRCTGPAPAAGGGSAGTARTCASPGRWAGVHGSSWCAGVGSSARVAGAAHGWSVARSVRRGHG
jgi:hypothetical protein